MKSKYSQDVDEKQKRNYKDSLFVDLFLKCPEAKENFLSLYNALHGTSLVMPDVKIEPFVLEQTIYTGRYNDVFSIELCVEVYNINNIKEEASISIIQKCPTLLGYSRLIGYARNARLQGRKDFLDYAVKRCIAEGILSEYLKRNSTEVRNMLIGEYDYDTDIQVQRMEASEEAAENAARKILEDNMSAELVSKYTSLPLEKILELKKESQAIRA